MIHDATRDEADIAKIDSQEQKTVKDMDAVADIIAFIIIIIIIYIIIVIIVVINIIIVVIVITTTIITIIIITIIIIIISIIIIIITRRHASLPTRHYFRGSHLSNATCLTHVGLQKW